MRSLLSLALGAGMTLSAWGQSAPAPAPAAAGPRIAVEPERFDFGRVLQQKTLEKEFRLRNFGNADLVIENVTTTCGCTVADGYAKQVAPGDSTTLRVKLETRTVKGRIERSVLIRSNDASRNPYEIKLEATVAPPAAQ